MSYIEDSTAAGRHIMPDLVRAVALIGIALVNISVIAYPLMGGYMHGGLNTGLDKIAFLFQGDILILYAILGTLLFLFRNASARTLMKWGIGFFIIQVLVFSTMSAMLYLIQAYAPEEMSAELAKVAETVTRSHAVYGSGSFTDSIALRFTEWTEIIQIGIFMDGMGAMAFFLFGLAAVKSGVISNPQAAIWQKCRRVFLPIGIIGSLIGAYIQTQGDSVLSPVNMLGMTVIAFFALFLSAGYLGLIAKWSAGSMTGLKTFLARSGTASLTAYLMQGLILSLIFNAYGLGWFGKLDAIYCVLIAFAAALLSLTFTSLWRQKFARGPLEYVLRKLTYLK